MNVDEMVDARKLTGVTDEDAQLELAELDLTNRVAAGQ